MNYSSQKILYINIFVFRVRLPARYDISNTVYGSNTDESQVYFLISLLLIDVPCYLNIILNFRLGVIKEHGRFFFFISTCLF